MNIRGSGCLPSTVRGVKIKRRRVIARKIGIILIKKIPILLQ
jgi:hypothetical protein